MISSALLFDTTSPATDGEHIILAMLIVGLVFLVVIGLGELTRSITHRHK